MSLDHDDYATFARIEDHLRRIADALERPRTDRLSELVDIAQRGLDRVAASFRLDRGPDDSRLAMQDLAMELRAALDAKPCDDRTYTDRDHWAPRGPNQCDPGCQRPSLHDGDCLERVTDALERAHPKFNPGGYVGGDYTLPEMPLRGGDRIVTREEAQRILRAGQELGFVAEADPLDESDHRARHNRHGGHIYRHGPEHWHDYGLEDGRCDMDPAGDDPVRLADFSARFGPLTFCDCDDTATIEAENGATD